MKLLTTLRLSDIVIPAYVSHQWNDLPHIMKIMQKKQQPEINKTSLNVY